MATQKILYQQCDFCSYNQILKIKRAQIMKRVWNSVKVALICLGTDMLERYADKT